MDDRLTRLKSLVDQSYNDPAFFNQVILGRSPFWSKQRHIAKLVTKHNTTVVQSANGVGKSYMAASIVLWYLMTRPNSIVLTTAPTAIQLNNVLWSNIRDAYNNSRIKLGGRLIMSPIPKLELADRWFAVGISTTKVEKLSGYHAKNMIAVIDEASGVEAEIFSALMSCNPEKTFMIGNPIRTDGHFYNICQKAKDPKAGIGFCKISTYDSPHIDLPRSPVGLADQQFLHESRNVYGENSAWWISHILGEFPETTEETLIQRDWLDKCVEEYNRRGILRAGPVRIGVDYSEGKGRDFAVIVVRDDNNLLDMAASNTWQPEDLALKVKQMVNKWNVQPGMIAWDANGPGHDFGNRLGAVGLYGCKGWKGSFTSATQSVGVNNRANAFWAVRNRLDPNRTINEYGQPTQSQPIFAISPQHMELLRKNLSVITYDLDAKGKIKIEGKDSIKAKLGGNSPDYADALSIAFCWGR